MTQNADSAPRSLDELLAVVEATIRILEALSFNGVPGDVVIADALDALTTISERTRRATTALEELADWSLPRWDPQNPQTEGEQMRLRAMATLGITI